MTPMLDNNMTGVGENMMVSMQENDTMRVSYISHRGTGVSHRTSSSTAGRVDKLVEHYADFDHERQHTIYLLALQIVSGLLASGSDFADVLIRFIGQIWRSRFETFSSLLATDWSRAPKYMHRTLMYELIETMNILS